jgi:hypothetical protein
MTGIGMIRSISSRMASLTLFSGRDKGDVLEDIIKKIFRGF